MTLPAAETVHGIVRNQLRHRKTLGSQLFLLCPYEHVNISFEISRGKLLLMKLNCQQTHRASLADSCS
jgi:hypothetical protein